jgi:hypothetical protein
MIGRIECTFAGVTTRAELADDGTWTSSDEQFARTLNWAFPSSDFGPGDGFAPQLDAAAKFLGGRVLSRPPLPTEDRIYSPPANR